MEGVDPDIGKEPIQNRRYLFLYDISRKIFPTWNIIIDLTRYKTRETKLRNFGAEIIPYLQDYFKGVPFLLIPQYFIGRQSPITCMKYLLT